MFGNVSLHLGIVREESKGELIHAVMQRVSTRALRKHPYLQPKLKLLADNLSQHRKLSRSR